MADEFDEYEALEAEAEALSQPSVNGMGAQAPARPTEQRQMIPIIQRGKGRPPVPKPQVKPVVQNQTQQNQPVQPEVQEETQVPEKKTPRYVIEHQPEIIALIDTLTGEAIPLKVETNIKDDSIYMLHAKVLNDLDTVITGAGYQ